MYDADVGLILDRRHQNGGDYWASPDGRIYVGNPYSTISCLILLHELGVSRDHEAVQGALDLTLAAWQTDGRFRLGPSTPRYPCYSAEAARALCRHGLAASEQLQLTAAHFLETAYATGGWRCDFTRFGRGPETECANPGATLYVLDVLRLMGHAEAGALVENAVESLLLHWETRLPYGPCHHGIGSQFLRIEFPFLRYNLFYYVYVLSFFPVARRDRRFRLPCRC